ncbi:hypothetical protein [Comamonas sp. NLF-1-9]|uniref:hypothetical protein n=1 Tax=Comamonas sp. NLF-1-9 TaxID=2853163 RepID=UPI001C466318|nr:hypothetical protein [Comamonas sp. NLF-1-9]QXL84970.1 hypothetical protein KUD94_03005 [Comamonas sp. NLF-1-9]
MRQISLLPGPLEAFAQRRLAVCTGFNQSAPDRLGVVRACQIAKDARTSGVVRAAALGEKRGMDCRRVASR